MLIMDVYRLLTVSLIVLVLMQDTSIASPLYDVILGNHDVVQRAVIRQERKIRQAPAGCEAYFQMDVPPPPNCKSDSWSR